MMKYFQMESLEEKKIIITHKSQSDLWGERVSHALTHEPIHHKSQSVIILLVKN